MGREVKERGIVGERCASVSVSVSAGRFFLVSPPPVFSVVDSKRERKIDGRGGGARGR